MKRISVQKVKSEAAQGYPRVLPTLLAMIVTFEDDVNAIFDNVTWPTNDLLLSIRRQKVVSTKYALESANPKLFSSQNLFEFHTKKIVE